jgi:hypothetical protein
MQETYCLTALEAAEMAGIAMEEMMQVAANETGVAVKIGDAWRVDFGFSIVRKPKVVGSSGPTYSPNFGYSTNSGTFDAPPPDLPLGFPGLRFGLPFSSAP